MKIQKIKNKFNDFFTKRKYVCYPSHPITDTKQKNLLFIMAGMMPFFKFLSGHSKSEHQKIYSIQKCIRISGKHNDFSEIGKSNRHHTSFEMLGTFDFENCNKGNKVNEAISFLELLGLNRSKMTITIHDKDTDGKMSIQSVNDIKEIVIDNENIWCASNENGPVGKSIEIYYPNKDGENIEIWNLVFVDGNYIDGNYYKSETIRMDTGAGLERIAMILQNVNSTYDIYEMQLIKNIINSHASKFNIQIDDYVEKILTDHFRTSYMLLLEKITPGPINQGYILRKLIRNMITNIYLKTSQKEQTNDIKSFMYDVCLALFKELAIQFDIKVQNITFLAKIMESETILFLNTIEKGKIKLLKMIKDKNIDMNEILNIMLDRHGLPIQIGENILKNYKW